MDLDQALTYLEFVEERHRVWEKRQAGGPGPWTDDPILASRKFTNVFRILDPGTQFILTDLHEDISPRDQLMRLFLYRHTGRIEVWQYLEMELGRYPLVGDLDDVLRIWQQYRGTAHVRTRNSDPRSAARTTQTGFKRSVFTSAYLVFPQTHVKGSDKLESIVRLTQRLFGAEDVWPDFEASTGAPGDQFQVLRRNKGVADFMSMQILTDWHYLSGRDEEDRFIMLGPGAKKGAAAIAPSWPAARTHAWAVDAVRSMPNRPQLRLADGSWRNPSWMDVQNTLCEFSKYARYAAKPTQPKPYVPAHPGPQPDPVLPAHWRSPE